MSPLASRPAMSTIQRQRLQRLFEQTQREPPGDLAGAVLETLGVDLETQYAGMPIPHPFGKASGQLSCTLSQVTGDVASGVGFVVLKTVIAEAPSGHRSMEEWSVPETKMRVERRDSATGRPGWTVTWKGRGWHGSLHEYARFFDAALQVARPRNIPVVPSVKYHLPTGDEPFDVEEYRHTTSSLLDAWNRAGPSGVMPLEKDFSPTLAGDTRASDRRDILRWLEQVPGLISEVAQGLVRVGVKVMNARFDDGFQVEMVRTLVERTSVPPAFLVLFNRLFDPVTKVAFGGWDLSDRNLRALDALRDTSVALPAISATGNINSGRAMVEYALRGCENGQLHTFFQLPLYCYAASGGSRTARALHTLMLHPDEGLVAWLFHLCEAGQLHAVDGTIRFRDVVGLGDA